jgi:23S rRNA (guanosine2251-2'-O)-methyltransferase
VRAGAPATILGGEQVEGHHAVHELLVAGRRQVRRLWVAADGADLSPGTAQLAELASGLGVAVERRPGAVLARSARTAAPQGVIAWADPVRAAPVGDLLGAEVPFLLVLDGVTDAGNFGSILRTAACAGVTGVVIGRHRSAPLTPAAVKAAAGAVEHVPVAVVAGLPGALADMARAGIWSVGLAADAPAGLWGHPLLDGPVALALGSEGKGLSPLVRKRCDALAHIAQVGPISSLNVATATAVACFEVARRRLG